MDLAEAQIKRVHLHGIFPEATAHFAFQLKGRCSREPACENAHALVLDKTVAIEQPTVGINIDRDLRGAAFAFGAGAKRARGCLDFCFRDEAS